MESSLVERIDAVSNFDTTYDVLSQWEKGFLESVSSWAKRVGRLSDAQFRTFAKMEAKCTPEAINVQKQWRDNFDAEKRAIAVTCAKYYKNTPYFRNIVDAVLSDPDFIPSQHQYAKMCENKYARKVVEAMNAPALYSVGDTVVLRAPAARNWSMKQFKGVPCLVVEVLKEVVNAAKGAKQYKILPYGHVKVLTIEEREIKKFKTPKTKTPKKKTKKDCPNPGCHCGACDKTPF